MTAPDDFQKFVELVDAMTPAEQRDSMLRDFAEIGLILAKQNGWDGVEDLKAFFGRL